MIADEAHRTQYDLIDGLARNLRDASAQRPLSWVSRAHPSRPTDHDTRAIFGDYIDIYDLTQAIEDEATVKVYYEARLVRGGAARGRP